VSGITGNYDINIYPVPASETINIQLTLAHMNYVEIELINIMGRTIDKQSLTLLEAGKHEMEFDISSLPRSVYFIRFSIDGEQLNKKIIVQ
jgi:serine protease AprX